MPWMFPFRVVAALAIGLTSWHNITLVAGSQAAGTETLVGIVGKDFVLLGADSSVAQGVALTASNLDKIAPLVEPFAFTDERSPTLTQQQTILAAAAGDAAISDRMIRRLQAHATIHEYGAGVGCDVQFVGASASGDGNGNGDGGSKPRSEITVEPGLTVEGMAYFARSILSASRPQANVCLLIAGMMLSTPDEGEVLRPSFLSGQVQQQVQQAWKKETIAAPASTTTTTTNSHSDEVNLAPESTALALRPHLYWLDELGSLQKIQYGAHGYGSNFCLSVLDQGYAPNMNLDEATKLLRDCFQQLRTRYIINSPQPPCIKCVDANGVRLIR